MNYADHETSAPKNDAAESKSVCISDAQIWRLSSVLALIGFTRSGLYRAMNEDLFPKPIRLGARAVGWKAMEVLAWIRSRPRVDYPSTTASSRAAEHQHKQEEGERAHDRQVRLRSRHSP